MSNDESKRIDALVPTDPAPAKPNPDRDMPAGVVVPGLGDQRTNPGPAKPAVPAMAPHSGQVQCTGCGEWVPLDIAHVCAAMLPAKPERTAAPPPPGIRAPTVPPAKPEPDPYAVAVERSRKTCGCASCLGSVRKTATGHVRTSGGGAAVTCLAASVFARLTEPGAK